jgi:gluconate 2-dehydrogenase alpha chain
VRVLPAVDVVIVGLGAAGGVAADVLTRAGMKVVGIEAGPHLTKADFLKQLDEIGGCFGRNTLGEPKFNHEIPTWRPSPDSPASDSPIVWPMMNAVGGTTIHYGAQSWRLSPGDFRVRSETIRRYGERAFPLGSSVADWPLSYGDLEPYYDRVEYEIGVCGVKGANPLEGKRTRDYPMPPLRPTGYTQKAEQAMRHLGYTRFRNRPPSTASSSEVAHRARTADSAAVSAAGMIPRRAPSLRRSEKPSRPASWRFARIVR